MSYPFEIQSWLENKHDDYLEATDEERAEIISELKAKGFDHEAEQLKLYE